MDNFEGPKIIVSHPGHQVRKGERYIGAAGICLVGYLHSYEVHQYDIQSQV